MSTIELREEAKALIDELSAAQLRVASQFLAFVKDRQTNAATLELLAIPGFSGLLRPRCDGHQVWSHQAVARGASTCIRLPCRARLSGTTNAATKPSLRNLARAFEAIEKSPRAGNNIKTLKGKLSGSYRYRVGDYRIVYTINEAIVTVFVITIANRKDVYD